MLEHSPVKSRQCSGMSDPEGDCPEGPMEAKNRVDGGEEFSAGPKFDDDGPSVLNEGKMEEEHTSSTR